MWKSQVGKPLKHCLENEDEGEREAQRKDGGVGRINEYLNLSMSYFQGSLLSCFTLSSSFFKSLLDRHTVRHVKHPYCFLVNVVILLAVYLVTFQSQLKIVEQ